MEMKMMTICLIMTVFVSCLDLAYGGFDLNLFNSRGRLNQKGKNIIDEDYAGCPRRADSRYHISELYEDENSEDCTTFINCGLGRKVQQCHCYKYDVDGTCRTRMRFKPQLHICVTPGLVKCNHNEKKESDEQEVESDEQ
ncbi:unnamed protein product [Owenia fusiformis]|uniref:Uncharacterized protein n=1 Tax=Owenia fusiformis TaxID=6347 RepID=A0A8J1XWH4_OWEFU|nr:unnamed protein product [Owenia fusiformis]